MNVNKTWDARKPESTTEVEQNLKLWVVPKGIQKIKETFKMPLQVKFWSINDEFTRFRRILLLNSIKRLFGFAFMWA